MFECVDFCFEALSEGLKAGWWMCLSVFMVFVWVLKAFEKEGSLVVGCVSVF